jgi:hypothetical protein
MAARSNVAFRTEKSVTRFGFVESASFSKINNKIEKMRTEEMRVIIEIRCKFLNGFVLFGMEINGGMLNAMNVRISQKSEGLFGQLRNLISEFIFLV